LSDGWGPGIPLKCTVDGQERMRSGRIQIKRNVPSDLPTCPTAASKFSDLAVEPILDFLLDRL
jgi:hypothetical protein